MSRILALIISAVLTSHSVVGFAQGIVAVTEVYAVGTSEQLCLDNANARANNFIGHTVRVCERNGAGRFVCTVSEQRLSELPGAIVAVQGGSEVAAQSEEACRMKATSTAETNAVELCENKFGVDCTLTKRGEATAEFKDDSQNCRGSAEAQPNVEQRFQCAVTITARAVNF